MLKMQLSENAASPFVDIIPGCGESICLLGENVAHSIGIAGIVYQAVLEIDHFAADDEYDG